MATQLKENTQLNDDFLQSIKKEKKFSAFFNVMKFFRPNKEDVIRQAKERIIAVEDDKEEQQQKIALNEIKKNLEKEIGRLIEDKQYHYVFEAMKNGYQPTDAQKNTIHDMVTSLVRTADVASVNTLLDQGYTLNDNNIMNFLFMDNRHGFANEYSHRDYLQHIHHLLNKEKTSDKKDNNALDTILIDFLSDSTKIAAVETFLLRQTKKNSPKYFRTGLQQFSDILCKEIPRDRFVQIIDYMKEINTTSYSIKRQHIIERSARDNRAITTVMADMASAQKMLDVQDKLCKDTITMMTENVAKYYPDHYKNLMNTVKEVYVENKIDNITSRLKSKESVQKLKNLPADAQTVMNSIAKYYQQAQNIQLDPLAKIQLDQTVDERIPHVLHKYYSIHEEYRETLFNRDGKNATQLLIESLTHLKSIFENIVQASQEDKLLSLTATNRYTQNIQKPKV